jgi:hypothetical protein
VECGSAGALDEEPGQYDLLEVGVVVEVEPFVVEAEQVA